jgi:hypothetical protein
VTAGSGDGDGVHPVGVGVSVSPITNNNKIKAHILLRVKRRRPSLTTMVLPPATIPPCLTNTNAQDVNAGSADNSLGAVAPSLLPIASRSFHPSAAENGKDVDVANATATTNNPLLQTPSRGRSLASSRVCWNSPKWLLQERPIAPTTDRHIWHVPRTYDHG